VFKFALIIFCAALLVLPGCVSTTETPPPLSEWSETNVVVSPVYPTWPPAASLAKTNGAAVSGTNPPSTTRTNLPPAKMVKPPPIYAYTSLNRWAAEQKLSAPLLVTKSPLTTYAVSSKNGVLTLAIGSREATWNGVTIHLGLPPEFIDGQVFVHGVDLRKNFEPLLTDPAVTFHTNRVIVIDPGHGGINAGTVSLLDQRLEKEFTLDWARRLAPLLASNGWTVFLTRTTDVDVSLSNRVAFAESHHADLFISLHFNSAAPDKRQNGLETYCLTPQGLPSTLTRGNPDFTSQWYPNNAFDTENLQLAVRLHANLVRSTGEEDRGVRRARFMGVLQGQRRPALLLEGGFLSNLNEAERIESGEFRQKLAETVAAALR